MYFTGIVYKILQNISIENAKAALLRLSLQKLYCYNSCQRSVPQKQYICKYTYPEFSTDYQLAVVFTSIYLRLSRYWCNDSHWIINNSHR